MRGPRLLHCDYTYGLKCSGGMVAQATGRYRKKDKEEGISGFEILNVSYKR